MEDLNMEELETLTPEEKVAKLLEYANAQKEARVKLQSDTDRGITKVLDEKKYLELITSEAKVLMKDKNYFTELLDKDEALAKAVLNEFFNGISIDDALAQVDDDKKQGYKSKKQEKSIEDTVKDLFTKKEITGKLSKFISEAKLSKEDKVAFDKEFADLTEGKKLDENNIDKYLRLAFKEALPDQDYRSIERDAMDMAQSKQGFTQTKTNVHNARKDNIEYLKKQGLL